MEGGGNTKKLHLKYNTLTSFQYDIISVIHILDNIIS